MNQSTVSGHRPLRRKTHVTTERPPFERIALLLQGGGALGSYQAGVYQALAEADLHPDWVAGISIGAINSALIAGNPAEKRVERLREFWEAITTPEFTARYFHGARLRVVGDRITSRGPNDELWGDDTVRECDPPRRLVYGWRSLYDEEMAKEAPSRVSWEIEPREGGFCLLTVVHDELEGAPKTAASVSGTGWMFVLSGLKTLLETGQPLSD